MIVGNGLIAKSLKSIGEREGVLLFASGVSNSQETRKELFDKELHLMKNFLNNHPLKLFIYVSTCSVEDPYLTESPYVQHKLKAEKLVREMHDNYLILRLPNIAGPGGNPKTMINFFVESIKRGQPLKIQKNAHRNILDSDDLQPIVSSILKTKTKNSTVNITNPINYKVVDIVKTIEKHLSKKAQISLTEGGSNHIKQGTHDLIVQNLRSDFGLDYLQEILEKHYR